MASFTDFDSRGYRMVDARTGYGEWVTTYEGTVEDAMDIALLERLKTPRWETVHEAADLGCGTGRTGEWLRKHGVEYNILCTVNAANGDHGREVYHFFRDQLQVFARGLFV